MVHVSLVLIALAPVIARWLIAWERADENWFSPADVAEVDLAFARVMGETVNGGGRPS